ncbi:MAG TPA: bidirectional hydrogenase complex protein HoxU [Kiritimatiellia bacterium]|nr:bidirectional hydrogenase complex protein HoxU [Kiritimatiellia bacterium]
MSPTPEKVITLTINGRDCGARENQTIMDVARENGIGIPALCHLKGLKPVGACRLCIVEIEGMRRPLPACCTTVHEGMKVTTQSDTLKAYRRITMEMILSEGNHICAVCVANGHCELQELARKLGVDHVDLPGLHPRREIDATHPLFAVDRNRCILCARCVRVCSDVEGAHTWDIMGRGIDCAVITDMNQPWGDSESCTRCGKCVHVCPTGALYERGKSVAEMQKRRNFLPYLTSMRERES